MPQSEIRFSWETKKHQIPDLAGQGLYLVVCEGRAVIYADEDAGRRMPEQMRRAIAGQAEGGDAPEW